MSGTETLLYLVGAPLAVSAIVWALVYRRGPGPAKRYRPGRPYRFAPVWYVANHGDAGAGGGREQLEAERDRRALPGGERPGGAPHPGVGGASDRW